MRTGAAKTMGERVRVLVSLLVVGVLIATSTPAAIAAPPAAPGTGETLVSRVFETTLDGKPLSESGDQFYEVKIADFGTPRPGEVGAEKKADPLPEVATGWDAAFEAECRDPARASQTGSAKGWTKNHYRWCRAVTVNWERSTCNNGNCRVYALLAVQTIWLGYADARNRKFHIWGKTFDAVERLGSFEDDARVGALAGCVAVRGKSSCSAYHQPAQLATLGDVKAKRNNVFETVLTDNSIIDLKLTGDAVVPVRIHSRFTGVGGAGHAGETFQLDSDHVESRCDSVKLRSKKACVFHNVSPYLTYDKNDTAYPLGDLIDHIRHAQNQLGAPGRWDNGGPDGPPLTRVRDAKIQRDNRKRPKAQCRQANPGGWNWRIQQCDEYPFASVREGGASGGPVSGRLISATHNREGGTQLNNWYNWDRVLHDDTFWVNLVG
ncbi:MULTISPECIES: NucA/NucB deoxyribonuclease domain-containing protein [Actinosynnema]|uniref:NucA/NucB deoxyribonuclease domain-containing protein n=1 Tax=Actinosynnema TaxID=40566 RepID=UPI0020A5902C|nr:NucA/NucB deoxyribonuclease domain-containing protein [Actinosynnema pretiosum]MCP2097703.1 Deoxyribonuclease NucA/NucB [Actinosynnema pretiosum]